MTQNLNKKQRRKKSVMKQETTKLGRRERSWKPCFKTQDTRKKCRKEKRSKMKRKSL